jgi:hypothetical protein
MRRIYEIAETEPEATIAISSSDGDVALMGMEISWNFH